MNQNQFKIFGCVLKHISYFEEFSLAELKSLLKMKGIDLKTIFSKEIKPEKYPKYEYEVTPQLFADYPFIKLYHNNEEELKQICERSNSIGYVFEYMNEGNSYEELLKKLKLQVNDYPEYFKNEQAKFHFKVNGINKDHKGDYQKNMGDMIVKELQIPGIIRLKEEDFVFLTVETHKPREEKTEQYTQKLQKIERLQVYYEQKGLSESEKPKSHTLTDDQLEEFKKQQDRRLQNAVTEGQKSYKARKEDRQIRKQQELVEFSQIPDIPAYINQLKQEIEQFEKESLQKLFFGVCRISSRNRRAGKIMFNYKYNLQERAYLGPTSADFRLAFFMANQAQVEEGHLVFDPYVGTAGLLIPPSHFGATCYGTDIDSRVIHGAGVGHLNLKADYVKKHKKELDEFLPKIMINFQQYELPRPEIIRMDCLTTAFTRHQKFDAVIADPPYGIRATIRKTGRAEGQKKNTSRFELKEDVKKLNEKINEKYFEKIKKGEKGEQEEQKQLDDQVEQQQQQEDEEEEEEKEKEFEQTWAPTQNTTLESQVQGLFSLADRVLVDNGKLVFLFPVKKEKWLKDQIACIPLDPRFQLRDFSCNNIVGNTYRILLTFDKIQQQQQKQ